jgi:hypothetical protein
MVMGLLGKPAIVVNGPLRKRRGLVRGFAAGFVPSEQIILVEVLMCESCGLLRTKQ